MYGSSLARSFALGGNASAIQSILSSHTPSRSMRIFRERTVRLMYWRSRSFDVVKYPVRRREDRQEWNYRSEIYAFSRRLQENLSQDKLRQVFAHKSYVDQAIRQQEKFALPQMNLQSNETLVLRGDALLKNCLKPYLRYSYRKLPEDGITGITDYLGSEAVLSDIATWIGCKDLILTEKSPVTEEDLANTLLALLAAIEDDLGTDRVQRFVIDMIVTYLEDKSLLEDVWKIPNPRETLNLILKNSGLPSYEPRIIFQTGINTLEACHIVGLYVNGTLIGKAPGETLDIAEETASLDAFMRIFDLTDKRAPNVYGKASETIDYKAYSKPSDSIESYRLRLDK